MMSHQIAPTPVRTAGALQSGFDKFMAEVSRRHQVPPREILGHCRRRDLVNARVELTWLLLAHTRLNKSGVARRLGVHHTTVSLYTRKALAAFGPLPERRP